MAHTTSHILLTAGIAILALLAAAGWVLAHPSLQPDPGRNEIIVFSAASLSGAMTDIAKAYETAHPDTKVILNFNNAAVLRTQIEQGASADVFLSANTKHMTALQEEGMIVNDSVRVFATTNLAIVVPHENRANITGLPDLAQPGVRLVMGVKEAPFGDYTRQALEKMARDPAFGPAYRDTVMMNVISEEPTLPSLIAKLRISEADAGIALASDVSKGDRAFVTAIPIPDQYNVVAVFPLGIVQRSTDKDRAAAFIDYIVSSEGASVLARYGFIPSGRQTGYDY
jgi:molybdate transport system substrate-binding protein